MNKKKNRQIIKRLKDYVIPPELSNILDLLYKHSDRLRFVKDNNGVRNLLFISTAPAERLIFEVPYFLITTKSKGKNALTYETKVSYTAEDIEKELTNFLEHTQERLFVGIGFEENEVTKADYMEILNIMEETKCNVVDAFVTLRRFPDWYDKEAELPFYIYKEQEYLKKFEESEKSFLMNKKQEILNLFHSVVESNNEEEFKKLSIQLKKINSQLTHYAKKSVK